MLNIYYGRENLNKEQFMYDNLREPAIIIVPDQYKLQTERKAIHNIGKKGLLDVEVLGFARVAARLSQETGSFRKTVINKYGKNMLLTKIIIDEKKELKRYRGMEDNVNFVELINDFIAEAKQHNTEPDAVREAAESGSLTFELNDKIKDLSLIYERYEEAMAGNFVDSDDSDLVFMEDMRRTDYLSDKTIWINGFNYFSPRKIDVIVQMAASASEVNVILTGDENQAYSELFALTGTIRQNLVRKAGENGISTAVKKIDDAYKYTEKSPAILGLEREFFNLVPQRILPADDITLVMSANAYNEAETAAAYIKKLVREEGLRYRDIAVIANNIENGGPIIKRIFDKHDIPVFIDRRHDIMGSPLAIFSMAVLGAAASGCNSIYVMQMIKTGMFGISGEYIDLLDEYVEKYRVMGSRWKEPFSFGKEEYSDETFEIIENARKQVMSLYLPFEKAFKEHKSIGMRTKAFYHFLAETMDIPAKAQSLIELQRKLGLYESAEETQQVWNSLVDILQQMAELIGEENVSMKNYIKLVRSGLESVEVGILPPVNDGVIVGTMQRTRPGDIKALVITGANEGVLPAGTGKEGLINEDEKSMLIDMGMQFFRYNELKIKEENMGIYKLLSAPEKHLWMSACASNLEGEGIRNSEVFIKLGELVPGDRVFKDIVSSQDTEMLIYDIGSTAEHLSFNLRNKIEGEDIDEDWLYVCRWFSENAEDYLKAIERGFNFSGETEALGLARSRELYISNGAEDYSVSPSRLEKFGRCPFAHFVSYGLRPRERRIFRVSGREVGDIYHEVFMQLSQRLTEKDVPITAPESKWMTITRKECDDLVDEIIRDEQKNYREGLFDFAAEEKFRLKKIIKNCRLIAWVLVGQVRQGETKSMDYEISFGRGKALDPLKVTLETDAGAQDIYIEGKIDRVDVMTNNRIKVIDYKTGSDRYSRAEAESGWKLQLMIYLDAAVNSGGTGRKPAGAFYFLVKEPSISTDGLSMEKLKKTVQDKIYAGFRLEGVAVDDSEVLSSINGGEDATVPVIPKKSARSPHRHLSESDFEKLQENVREKIVEICGGITGGRIDIKPKRIKDRTACDYCEYKSICGFDPAFRGCEYEVVEID